MIDLTGIEYEIEKQMQHAHHESCLQVMDLFVQHM